MSAAGVIAAAVAAGVIALSTGGGSSGAPAGGGEAETAGVAGLTPGELAGQRLVAGWRGGDPPKGLKKLIRQGGLAGVIVFAENVGSRKTVRSRIRKLQKIRDPEGLRVPLLVSVDQEGGQVKRLSGPPSASAAEMGSRGAGYARKQGSRTGRSLRGVGINTDLAPVLDVARPGGAIDREQRSFGGRPGRVIKVGVRGFADGLRRAGAATTAKHFPGIGMIATNTDFASQKVGTSRRKLRRIDEPPFGAFAKSGGELVMLSNATYTAFSNRPAVMSRKIVTGELRKRLGFGGVTISDSLDAAAIQAFGGRGEVALGAVGAGTDLLLYGSWRDARSIRNLLRDRLAKGRLDRDEFERSVARVLELRRGLGK